ncbi:MAG: hypothetical protein AABN33_04360 [Acidobacteriota bacterium]
MKTLSALTLIAALAIIALAQRAENNTDEKLRARNAPDVFMYSASAFGPDKNGDSNFTIEVGNTGAKTTTAIEWEYNSSRDVAGYDKRVNGTFRNPKLKLLPDERTKLTQQVHHYTDKFVTGFNLDTVRIM